MPRICAVIAYFGAWPQYMDLYLQSCRANPHIDFVFFTDLKLENETALGKNVIVHRITFEDISKIARKKLDIDVRSADPYKLCDLRPAYGVIFQEFLSEYEYWGWSDIDIVLGRTKQFLRDLDVYDIWCVRKEWTTGSWTLLRNNEEMNSLFKRSRDWKMVFESSKNWAFDECGGVWHQLSRGIPIEETNSPIISFTHIVREAMKEGLIKGHFRDIAFENTPRLLAYDGRIIDIDRQEYFLFHSIIAKADWIFIYPCWHGIIPKKYYINRFGFFIGFPLRRDVFRLVFSGNGLRQIKDKLLRRIKKTLLLLRKGDYNYLWRDLKRRLKVGINTSMK